MTDFRITHLNYDTNFAVDVVVLDCKNKQMSTQKHKSVSAGSNIIYQEIVLLHGIIPHGVGC